MKIVLKIGGSMVFDENGPKISYLKKLIPVIKQIKSKNQLIVSIGGGKYARKYARDLKNLLTNKEIEWIYVDLLKANVRLLSFLLDMKPIFELKNVKNKTSGIIGGIVPKRSTDTNAAICAQKIKADLFVKLTDVPGIYTKDPDKFRDVKFMRTLTFHDLHKIKTKTGPGSYGILDPSAIDIITRNRIKTVVMSGKNPKKLLKAIRGKHVGTIVC
jgi:uridylate kinase